MNLGESYTGIRIRWVGVGVGGGEGGGRGGKKRGVTHASQGQPRLHGSDGGNLGFGAFIWIWTS